MGIPFFSIDFKINDWNHYFKGSLGLNFEKKFESELTKRFKNRYFLKFPSSRMSFYLILETLFKPEDEIIFSAMSFPLYIKMCCQLNITPVLVDVEPDHLTLNPDLINKNITSKTKAIVVTNLFGHPAYLKEISDIAKNNNLILIEDCAQSLDSFYENQETGSYGDYALFSTGAVKTPTTLGGGILISKNNKILEEIKNKTINDQYNKNIKKLTGLYIKNLISILNSYPFIYSLLSHKVIGILKKRNPELMRKIFYSGIVENTLFNPWERPMQINYQYSVGISQFSKIREMTLKRKRNSLIFDNLFTNNKKILFLKEGKKVFWNYQYYILYSKNNIDLIYNEMFKNGIHLLYENVWDCSKYNLPIKINFPIENTKNFCKHLIRLPNNSLLNKNEIINIGYKVNNILNK